MNWFARILEQERASHLAFFGKEFDLHNFEKTLQKYGEEKVGEWKKLLLEPHFLPKIKMSRKAKFPGWKVRPDNHCYEVVYEGKVLRMVNGQLEPDKKAHWLSGETILIDTRLKPTYQDGKQMYQDDNLLGPILARLRQSSKIETYQYGPQSSRFGVSADEWENQIKSALSQNKELGLRPEQWRLERVAEAVVIPQLYLDMPRKGDGQTSTWVWYEEHFEDRSRRLYGGSSDCGGLADVSWYWSVDRWNYGSFRPLAVL